MKKTLLIAIMAIVGVLTMKAERSWSTPGEEEYSNHIVVMAALKTPSGVDLGANLANDVQLGAFIGESCRAVASKQTYGTTTVAGYYFFLRIGVADADAAKNINFVLKCNNVEYTLEQPIAVEVADKTYGTISDLYTINYNPLTEISPAAQDLNIFVGETQNLNGWVKFVALDNTQPATMPDSYAWDAGNYAEYFTITDNVLTPVKPNLSSEYAMNATLAINTGYVADGNSSSFVEAAISVYVHKHITGMTLNSQDFPNGIEVNVGDSKVLTDLLSQVLTITPADATESVKWAVTTPEGTDGIVELDGGLWNPAKVGNYVMRATYGSLTPVDVNVKVIQPATDLTQLHSQINVVIGDEVKQYLPYTFSIVPADATYGKEDGITYTIGEGSTGLTLNEDGTITASATGRNTITITHRDLPNKVLTLDVSVVDFPTTKDYEITANPLSKSLKEAELSKLNIYTELTGNVVGSTSFMKTSFPSQFTFAEVNDSPILTQLTDGATTGWAASKYGTTTVKWTYTTSAAKIVAGTFQANAEYSHEISYRLKIVAGLNSVTVNALTIGLYDTDAVLTLTTDPENMYLEDGTFNFQGIADYLTIGDRTEGKNEWAVTPKKLAKDVSASIEHNDEAVTVTAGSLTITQRLALDAGWHWASLYTGALTTISASDEQFDKIQEIRSRGQLTYNDPKYGFFGDLTQMTTAEGYKVNVKTDQVFNMLVPMTEFTADATATTKTLTRKWNWVSNPYCFNHDLNSALGKAAAWTEGSKIISKSGGFAEYTQQEGWSGTLQTLVAGEAYLIYNASEENVSARFPAENDLGIASASSEISTLSLRSKSRTIKPWQYDDSRFADNMSIVARGTTQLEDGRYLIGAFVGDECRGEGVMIRDRFFITVHGNGGEKVNFKLYDCENGEYISLYDELSFATIAGTYADPVTIDTSVVSGISDINADGDVIVRFVGDDLVVDGIDASQVEIYSISGARVAATGLAKGVYVVKAGNITRKMIKK